MASRAVSSQKQYPYPLKTIYDMLVSSYHFSITTRAKREGSQHSSILGLLLLQRAKTKTALAPTREVLGKFLV